MSSANARAILAEPHFRITVAQAPWVTSRRQRAFAIELAARNLEGTEMLEWCWCWNEESLGIVRDGVGVLAKLQRWFSEPGAHPGTLLSYSASTSWAGDIVLERRNDLSDASEYVA